ncbi:ribonuclease III [Peptoanaerobacter stomatis]|uniref:Ribonuclease 3 n=1 Tax=Peptoanaerobacter stomatis TaxID=796937 RepID=G9WYU3_9FIRM|nr:ribonuclease III [Peptoanaerobacter stomatis]EHL16275.1 ribonuclease III [Peptoanaerobacter stomatis]EHL17431.1 ribonuclease III [Peptoanaerobacter stomatis]EJU19778.1 ribonuclease III [Peptoanaerobacter stomatis]NWO24649.1 ribonuclease III [Peptostreptococcaceae bacterium oral taxon 081]
MKSDKAFFSGIEKNIGYVFENKGLIKTALTHSSYVNENKNSRDNERLEFLGDSILSLVVSNYIFNYKSNLKEGELTKIRASCVCEKSLINVANKLKIGDYIRLGKGEQNSGGKKRTSILADATEAIIAAIYLDSDLETVSKYVILWLEDTIVSAIKHKKDSDYKSKLQEEIQKVKGRVLKYEVVDVEGPDHDRKFTICVYCDNKLIGKGQGNSKKEAEQNAAQDALSKPNDNL